MSDSPFQWPPMQSFIPRGQWPPMQSFTPRDQWLPVIPPSCSVTPSHFTLGLSDSPLGEMTPGGVSELQGPVTSNCTYCSIHMTWNIPCRISMLHLSWSMPFRYNSKTHKRKIKATYYNYTYLYNSWVWTEHSLWTEHSSNYCYIVLYKTNIHDNVCRACL